MSTVTFVEHDGTPHDVDLIDGESLMVIATDNAVPGIDGDCGGEAACGTCHVIVDDAWVDAVGPRTEVEGPMLEMSPDLCRTSRLACQVTGKPELDGLVVRLPEFQM